MRKFFYHPDTLKIMGMSDGEDSMSFPSLETEKGYHSTKNLKIVKEKGKLKIRPAGRSPVASVNSFQINRPRGHNLTKLQDGSGQ